jgi:hypothetical protein
LKGIEKERDAAKYLSKTVDYYDGVKKLARALGNETDA